MDLIFRFKDNVSQFNLTNKYMTLFHMGNGSVSSANNGIQVCLNRQTSDSNPIRIGLRTKTGAGNWAEVSGSFVDLSSIGSISTDGFMILLSYSGGGTTINFNVTQFNNTTSKTTSDFTFSTSSGTSFGFFGASNHQWGFGSSPEAITISGAIATSGYNSYVSQNISLICLRTWSAVIPLTATGTNYAMFNTNNTTYSLYNLNKSDTLITAALAPASLNFQLIIPSGANPAISTLQNSNGSVTTNVSSTYGGLPNLSSGNFLVNDSTCYTLVTANDIPCLLKGTQVLTMN